MNKWTTADDAQETERETRKEKNQNYKFNITNEQTEKGHFMCVCVCV